MLKLLSYRGDLYIKVEQSIGSVFPDCRIKAGICTLPQSNKIKKTRLNFINNGILVMHPVFWNVTDHSMVKDTLSRWDRVPVFTPHTLNSSTNFHQA